MNKSCTHILCTSFVCILNIHDWAPWQWWLVSFLIVYLTSFYHNTFFEDVDFIFEYNCFRCSVSCLNILMHILCTYLVHIAFEYRQLWSSQNNGNSSSFYWVYKSYHPNFVYWDWYLDRICLAICFDASHHQLTFFQLLITQWSELGISYCLCGLNNYLRSRSSLYHMTWLYQYI